MKWLIRAFVSASLTLLVVLLVFILFAVDFEQPRFAQTELSDREYGTYYYTLRNVLKDSSEPKKQFVFSPRETSYLVEQYLEGKSRGTLQLVDVLVRGSGDRAVLKLALRGPLGLYYRLNFHGTVKYSEAGWNWEMDSLHLGALPVHYFVSASVLSRLPDEFAGGKLQLDKFRLDGQGLKAVLRLKQSSGEGYPLLDLLK